MRSISSMIAEVRSQTDEVRGAVSRLRDINRAMTGSTGEVPTQLTAVRDRMSPETPSLLIQLNDSLEQLNGATADLRNELSHAEGFAETGVPSNEKVYGTSGLAGRN